MKKIFTFVMAALVLPISASAALEVSLGDQQIKDGDVLKYSIDDIRLGDFGWQKELHFEVKGATPLNVAVSSNTDIFSFCTTSCYPLMDLGGTGVYSGKDVINATPQDLAIDWYTSNYDATPGDYDDWCAVSLYNDDEEMAFRIEINTKEGAINGIINDATSKDSKIYNLQGAEVKSATLTPGIYIQNGKKIIVK